MEETNAEYNKTQSTTLQQGKSGELRFCPKMCFKCKAQQQVAI